MSKTLLWHFEMRFVITSSTFSRIHPGKISVVAAIVRAGMRSAEVTTSNRNSSSRFR